MEEKICGGFGERVRISKISKQIFFCDNICLSSYPVKKGTPKKTFNGIPVVRKNCGLRWQFRQTGLEEENIKNREKSEQKKGHFFDKSLFRCELLNQWFDSWGTIRRVGCRDFDENNLTGCLNENSFGNREWSLKMGFFWPLLYRSGDARKQNQRP